MKARLSCNRTWAIGSLFMGVDLTTKHAHGLAVQAAPDEKFDWVIRYQSRIRVIPLIAGGVGILGVLVNRLIFGVRLAFSPAPCSAWRYAYPAMVC